MRQEKIYMYGRHALMEALRSSPDMLDAVFLSDRPDSEITSLLHKNGITLSRFDSNSLPPGVEKHANHQGFIGRIALPRLMKSYDTFIDSLEVTNDTCLVLLGEIHDPQNVGAIIRTAAAFGIAGVLIPEHRQAQVTGAVVKVSAGMTFRVPLVAIGNVNMTLKDLKERGFWTYGLDGEAKQSIHTETFDAPSVFILGNEARGIREKTLEACDIPIVIPMHPHCESLNVAASAAVALYAWSARHPGALR